MYSSIWSMTGMLHIIYIYIQHMQHLNILCTSSLKQYYTISGVFRGGGGATAPPLWPDHKFFWLILHCFVGFISRLNRIKSVSRGMDVCIIQMSIPDQRLLVTCPCLQLRRVVTAGELQQMDCSKRCSS